MGEKTDLFLGLVGRSLVRHAIVGVLTAGVGNAVLLAGDVLDTMDTMDTIDALDSVSAVDATTSDSSTSSSGGGGVHFCGSSGDEVDGYKYDKQADVYHSSPDDYYHGRTENGQTYDDLKKDGKV
ncbi:hypothetical protein ACJ41O_007227 [Fusarium nematophilum]